MSNQVDQIKYIQKMARWVDRTANGGNHDGVVDGNEVSIFVQKLNNAGIKNSQKIIENYNNNKFGLEAKFDFNNTNANSSVQAAVISSVNKQSFLNENSQGNSSYKSIIQNMESSLKGGWGFWGIGVNGDKLKNSIGMINKNNVFQVLTHDNKLITNFVNKGSKSDIENYGASIIAALLGAAAERQIDVSNIIVVSSKQPKYSVGRDINAKSVKFGDSATTEAALPVIVSALLTAINNGKKLAVNQTNKKNPDKQILLSSLADKVDASHNGGNDNGIVDGNEVTEFKKLAANAGIDVNTILDAIRTKSDKKESLTKSEQFVKDLFTSNERKVKLNDDNIAKDSAKGVMVGIEEKNGDFIGSYLQNVNKDTVMEFLDSINNSGYKGSIGHKLYTSTKGFFGGDNSQQYTARIVDSLINYANEKEVDISDIVKKNSDASYSTTSGDNALDPKIVDSIINKLQARIKYELS